MTIFNATENIEIEHTTSMELVEMDQLFRDRDGMLRYAENNIHDGYIRMVAATWPTDSLVCLDLEGRPSPAPDGLDLWYWPENPETAVRLRWLVWSAAQRARPDCRIGIWRSIADWWRVADQVKGLKWGQTLKDTEEGYGPQVQRLAHARDFEWLGRNAAAIFSENYWYEGHAFTEDSAATWKHQVNHEVHAAGLFYGRQDLICFLTPNAWRLSPEILDMQLGYLDQVGLDAALWLPQGSTFIPPAMRDVISRYGDPEYFKQDLTHMSAEGYTRIEAGPEPDVGAVLGNAVVDTDAGG